MDSPIWDRSAFRSSAEFLCMAVGQHGSPSAPRSQSGVMKIQDKPNTIGPCFPVLEIRPGSLRVYLGTLGKLRTEPLGG